MAKLIVEEGGGRRAFRMGKGVLTVGSGAEARLRLTSADVAEVHLELELEGEVVKLRPRPGVVPPKVAGKPASGEVVLVPGQEVQIGSARLRVEVEGAPAAATTRASAPAATPDAASAAPATRAAPVTPVVRSRRDAEPRPARERGRKGDRPAPKVPTWLFVVLVLAGVGLAFLAWSRLIKSGSSDEGLANNQLHAARQAYAAARFDEARAKLAGISLDTLTPELAERKAELEREIDEAVSAETMRVENDSGTGYFDTLLKKYESVQLQGTPEPAKVRLFLQRCREFRRRWPRHPELDWVERQEARFAGYVDMNAPLTLADVEWQVKDLVDGMPRNYAAAFALVDEFLGRAEGFEREAAQKLRDDMVAARPDYAQDRLFEARHQFEKKNDTSKAVWWLVNNVAWLGDEALANESARFLVRMPDLQAHLLGYKAKYPERYAAVMGNEVVASWARDAGFQP